jgi:hypothetical protein
VSKNTKLLKKLNINVIFVERNLSRENVSVSGNVVLVTKLWLEEHGHYSLKNIFLILLSTSNAITARSTIRRLREIDEAK